MQSHLPSLRVVARPLAALLALVAPLAGCPEAPREEADLVEMTAWSVLDAGEDPFPDHRAVASQICAQDAVRTDGAEGYEVLDVDTATCPYLAAGQRTLAEVRAGDVVQVLAWHQTLASVDAGQSGHMALTLDGALLWEILVPIPAGSLVYEVDIPMEESVPEGAMITVHVHNHGANTWRLGHVRVIPQEKP